MNTQDHNTKITVCLLYQLNNSLLRFKISLKTYPLPSKAGTIGLFLFSSTQWHLVHLVLNSVPVSKRIMPDSLEYQLISLGPYEALKVTLDREGKTL